MNHLKTIDLSRRTTRLVGLLSLLFAYLAHGQTHEYAVHGYLNKVGQAGTRRIQLSFAFDIIVQGNKWSITTYTNIGTARQSITVWQSTFDGINLYALPSLRMNPQAAGEPILFPIRRLVPIGRPDNHVASVAHGISPLANISMPEIVWLAFASNYYLDTVKTNRLKPFWNDISPKIVLTDYTVPAIWTRMGEQPRLPSYIAFITSEVSGVISPTNNTLVLTPRRPGFSAYTNAVYKATTTTNLPNGLRLPLAFTFTRSVGTQTLFTASGSVTRIRTGSFRGTFTPDLAGKRVIEDLRFLTSNPPPTIGALLYPSDKWLPVKDPFVQANYHIHTNRNK